jgi:2-keto-3-deoxy-6-phosphogluconate aldolase
MAGPQGPGEATIVLLKFQLALQAIEAGADFIRAEEIAEEVFARHRSDPVTVMSALVMATEVREAARR